MRAGHELDLVVLTPGKDDRATLEALISKRAPSLGIRSVRCELLVHPRRDAGCFQEGPEILDVYRDRAAFALVVFDHEGCGQEGRSADELRNDLMGRLTSKGWRGRAEVVILEPELEAWVWSDSPHVDRELGWEDPGSSLREWLRDQGLWPASCAKPPRPKEAVERTLRATRLQRSSAIYRRLAERVGLRRCQDTAFLQVCEVLREWFPR